MKNILVPIFDPLARACAVSLIGSILLGFGRNRLNKFTDQTRGSAFMGRAMCMIAALILSDAVTRPPKVKRIDFAF